MLTIEKTVLASPEQMQMVIEGMRNPKNSWDRSDSSIEHIEDSDTMETAPWQFHLGEADHELMRTLAAGGSVHAKYRRMMTVMVTINAPLYWWKEFDTYKVGTVANSCSTMHKIHDKPFDISDFSAEHLFGAEVWKKDYDGPGSNCFINFPEVFRIDFEDYDMLPYGLLKLQIAMLNKARELYLQTNDKSYWWNLIQLLPSSYNQKRTVMLNYEVLSHIYADRRDHKLDEWHIFCDWVSKLPYADLIIPGDACILYADNKPFVIGADISEGDSMTVNELREELGLERVEDVSFLGNIREESNNG